MRSLSQIMSGVASAQKQRLDRGARAFAAVAVAAWFVVSALPAWNAEAYDLSALAVAAKVVRSDGFAHLYEHNPRFYNRADGRVFLGAARELGFHAVPTPFVHSPLVAVACEPLTALPYRLLAHAWILVAAAAFVAGIFVGARYFAPSLASSPRAMGVLFLALLGFEPTRYALWLGQTTPFVFLVVMLALFAAGRGRNVGGGLALAIAAFVKLTPLLFVVPWLWRRRSRAALACGGGLAALAAASLAVAGFGPNREYLARVGAIGRTTVVAYNNHGLPALLESLRQPAGEMWRWKLVRVGVDSRVIVAVVGIGMAVAAWRALRPLAGDARERLAMAAASPMILVLPTISWTHYFVFLVPPALAAWERARRGSASWIVRGALALALALLSVPLAFDEIAMRPGPLTFRAGPSLAAILVFGAVLVAARLPPPDEA